MPQVGKIQELYDANSRRLYSQPSPYTENSEVFSFGPRQPFVYTKIDDGKKGLNRMKRFDSQSFPFISSIIDTKRMSKFMVTGNGLVFITKQFFLQKNQAFNETRVYNPLSPILAASTRLNPLSDKNPSRFIDTSGGPMGMLKSFIGLPSKTVPAPPGTVGLGSLSEKNKASSKGLLRAHTAINGYSRLDPSSKSGGSSLLASLKSLFSYKPQKQPANASFRSDEGGYGIQLKPGAGKFDYFDRNGSPVKWGEDYFMRFEAGKNNGNSKSNIKKKGESSTTASNRNKSLLRIFGKSISRSTIYGNKEFGYDQKEVNGYIRYGQNVGVDRISSEGDPDTFRFSEMLSIYGTYTSKGVNFEAKFSDKTKKTYQLVEENLQATLKKLDRKKYNVTSPDITVSQFSSKEVGMDVITSGQKKYSELIKDSKYSLDSIKGFSGTRRGDRLNSLTILDKNGAGYKTSDTRTRSKDRDKNDEINGYSPYRDDQIAFYFHDLVNNKYIPFRATVKGITEQLTSNWSEISYIGRADKLFNYTGFSRSLNFSFTVSAMSLTELLPMWVRINYLATLVKPSRYTSGGISADYIVPPMTSITIGDLYKEQPFVLKSVGITIPEDALWETTPEISNTSDWSYLNEKIVYKNSSRKGLFAQFPRECELTVVGELLEREQPGVGKANFGGLLETAGKFSDRLKTII